MDRPAQPGRWRTPDLTRLVGSQAFNQAGDGMAQAIFAEVLLLQPLDAGDPTRILSVFALTLLPYSVVSPFLGVLVDRWARRRVMVTSNLIRALMMVALAASWASVASDPMLYGAVLLVLGMGRLFSTAKGAALPVVVHERHLLRANSLSGAVGIIGALVGAVAGVGAIAIMSAPAALTLVVPLYLIGAAAAARISTSLSHSKRPRLRAALLTVVRDLTEGTVTVWRSAGARFPLIAVFLMRATTIVVAIVAILLIGERFGGEGRGGRLTTSALALGAAGVGAFVGSLCAPALGRRLGSGGVMGVGFALTGLALLAGAWALSLGTVYGLMFATGWAGFVVKVAADASVQRSLPDDHRGRAFALYDILYNGASVAAAAAVVLMVPLGLPAVLGLTGISAGVAGGLVAFWLTRSDVPGASR